MKRSVPRVIAVQSFWHDAVWMVQPSSSRLFWDSLSWSVTVQNPTRELQLDWKLMLDHISPISRYFMTQFTSKKPLVEKSNISCPQFKENQSWIWLPFFPELRSSRSENPTTQASVGSCPVALKDHTPNPQSLTTPAAKAAVTTKMFYLSGCCHYITALSM